MGTWTHSSSRQDWMRQGYAQITTVNCATFNYRAFKVSEILRCQYVSEMYGHEAVRACVDCRAVVPITVHATAAVQSSRLRPTYLEAFHLQFQAASTAQDFQWWCARIHRAEVASRSRQVGSAKVGRFDGNSGRHIPGSRGRRCPCQGVVTTMSGVSPAGVPDGKCAGEPEHAEWWVVSDSVAREHPCCISCC